MSDSGKALVLFDTEEEYAQMMTEYLRKHRELPWEIRTYTNLDDLMKREKNRMIFLVVSEGAFCPELELLNSLKTVILNESGIMKWEEFAYIDKFQSAENVVRELLQLYLEVADAPLPRIGRNCETQYIGFYSPVARSYQTSFSLTMGQLLAQEHSVLYLNFEYCAGIGELLPDMQVSDMADLLYFVNTEREKFRLRLHAIARKIGALDYVPPMKFGQNLLSITGMEWLNFLRKIEELGEYEYVLLDLSDNMQGLFEILRQCKCIFTTGKEDRIAQSKLLQYEQLLSVYEYDDIIEKTRKLTIPQVRKLPEDIEQYTKGDFSTYVRKVLEDI